MANATRKGGPGRAKKSEEDKAMDADIGALVRAARVGAGMTQSELAEAVGGGLLAPKIWEYEQGRTGMTAARLVAFARAIGCRIEDLVPEQGPGQGSPVRKNYEIAFRTKDPKVTHRFVSFGSLRGIMKEALVMIPKDGVSIEIAERVEEEKQP